MSHTALLALEDGSLFYGQSIGTNGEVSGEVVFNTSMTGYQEILTDPSYYQQIVTMTYPHIGNVGVNLEDYESDKVFARGLIIKQLPFLTSNWRSEKTLNNFLVEENIVAIADIDTRRLTRILRDKGAQNGCIVSGENLDADKAIKVAREFPGLMGADLAKDVTTNKHYEWSEGTWSLETKLNKNSKTGAQKLRVVAYDFGVKRNILRMLRDRACKVTVVPADSSFETI